MLWIKESISKSKKLRKTYSLNDIQIFIKDSITNDIDIEFVLSYIKNRIPKNFMRGVDVIYIGQFEELLQRDISAYYEDGAIFMTNEQDNEMDMIDDIIHEIAHACEKQYGNQIYNGSIEREFKSKRERLYYMLKSENYNVSPIFRVKMEYDKDIDNFLYREVGYDALNSMVVGLFVSAYASTSISEYFARGFEEYFMGDIKYLKTLSPAIYNILESLTEMEEQ